MAHTSNHAAGNRAFAGLGTRGSALPIWRLVEESMSEAAFLWLRLDSALNADDHSLEDVERWVEERLQGALDGVCVAGSSALDSLLPEALEDEDLGAVAAAAYLTAGLKDSRSLRLLEQALRQATPARAAPLACALGRTGDCALLHALWTRMAEGEACARASLLDALTFCGEAPSTDLRSALESPEPALRRAAARALRFLPSSARDKLVSRALASADLAVRTHACIASLAAGDAQAWNACVARAKPLDLDCAELLPLLAALGSAREHARVEEALSVPELRRQALWALGLVGTRDAAQACLAQLAAGRDVHAARGALVMMTGMPRPMGPAADSEDPLDLEPIHAWWQSHGPHFEAGARYLDGERVSLQKLQAALLRGPTRRRHALALELSIRTRGAFCLQPLAFCRAQREQLASLQDGQLEDSSRTMGVQPLASA